MHPTRLAGLLAVASALLASSSVLADTHATAPPGGGLPALDVSVDLAGPAVVWNGARLPIPLAAAQLPAPGEVAVEALAIGKGRHVVHVRVPVRDGEGAWEAILAAGETQPVFAGLTGFVAGDPGERTGKAVQIVPDGATSFVLVGDVREELRICGQSRTLFDPEALYPATLDLRPATMQRLSAEERASAQRIIATDRGQGAEPALARLLVARGSSVPGSRGVELTDGDVHTVWKEQRPGAGQGEFVVMAAPKDAPITRMQIVVAPPAPDREGAAPKSLYLVTSAKIFEVTLPGDAWLKPGEAYQVAFPQPLQSSCVALVLGDAYGRTLEHPEVSVAELTAYSEFDVPGATLEDVAKKLTGDRGIAAAQVLERAGEAALAAVVRVYGELDPRGRALAVDVAAAHERCDEAAPLLARGLCDKGGEAPRKAREKLERCKGAAPVLARSLREDASSRACVAPTLAVLAPQDALEPIADAMAATGDEEPATREVLRTSFAEALKGAPPGRLAALIADTKRSAMGRLEVMRAAEARVAEAAPEAEATATELLRGAPPMRIRYLVLGPLGELARAGKGTAASLVADVIARDPEWPVRARAAEVAAAVPGALAALAGAARDPEPRVREAALQSLAASPGPGGVEAARAALTGDGWSFVRVQAVGVLAKGPPSPDADRALGDALHDASARVRGASLVALARRRATSMHEAIRERLDDKDEDTEVRASAARALGAVCDSSSADRLTQVARVMAIGGSTEDQQQIAIGALVGLAAMQPADLRDRLAPLLASSAPPYARAAAQQALVAHGVCR